MLAKRALRDDSEFERFLSETHDRYPFANLHSGPKHNIYWIRSKPDQIESKICLGLGLGRDPDLDCFNIYGLGLHQKQSLFHLSWPTTKQRPLPHVKLCYKAACTVSVTPCPEALPLTYLHEISPKAAFGCTVDKDYDLRYLSSEDKNKKV